jgi:hypothetical protein
MEGKTIKTLAEYIAQLHENNSQSEFFKDYANDEFDTNGVEQDHVETFWPPDIHSGANK